MERVPSTNEHRLILDDENKCLLPEFCTKRTVILGCGNILFGDDGFGPAVVEHLLSHVHIPENVYVMDVGTGARELLFTLALSPKYTQRLAIIDAVDMGRTPGEIFEIQVGDLPPEKTDDLSMHQVPSSNLARELTESGVEIRVLVCQVDEIPKSVRPGLSDAVKKAVPEMCSLIAEELLAG